MNGMDKKQSLTHQISNIITNLGDVSFQINEKLQSINVNLLGPGAERIKKEAEKEAELGTPARLGWFKATLEELSKICRILERTNNVEIARLKEIVDLSASEKGR